MSYNKGYMCPICGANVMTMRELERCIGEHAKAEEDKQNSAQKIQARAEIEGKIKEVKKLVNEYNAKYGDEITFFSTYKVKGEKFSEQDMKEVYDSLKINKEDLPDFTNLEDYLCKSLKTIKSLW